MKQPYPLRDTAPRYPVGATLIRCADKLAEEIWGRLGPKGHLAMPWIWSVLFTDLLSVSRDEQAHLTRNILRKEVIQPQVPLRLPCYDFTPVADPTVAAASSKGWRTAVG